MGGKGETVNYTRLFEEGPLTDEKKQKLKNDIDVIINAATESITIIALVEPTPEELRKALEKALEEAERKKREKY